MRVSPIIALSALLLSSGAALGARPPTRAPKAAPAAPSEAARIAPKPLLLLRLKDGRPAHIEGGVLFIGEDDGAAVAPVGEYRLQDGRQVLVAEGGKAELKAAKKN